LSTTALTKNGRKVSGTPSWAAKAALWASRSATSPLTSASIIIHAWGAVCLLATMWRAMALRIGSGVMISSPGSTATGGKAPAGAVAAAGEAGPVGAAALGAAAGAAAR